MFRIIRYALVCIVSLGIVSGHGASAQTYMGDDAFDGTHKNEVTGYMSLGSNIISGFFMGPAVEYKRHFTPRWSAMGASEYQFDKQKFGIYGKGEYRLPVWKFNFYFSGKVMYNRYHYVAR